MFAAERKQALEWDAMDPLAEMRGHFAVSPNHVYMDGNSLGLVSQEAEAAVQSALADWKAHAIDGWSSGERPWFTMAEQLAGRVASLVGAIDGEVAVTGSTTSNLHQLLATLYKPTGTRRKIVVDTCNFPSDLYAVESHVVLHGGDPRRDIVWIQDSNGLLATEDIVSQFDDTIALALFSSVLYRSGQALPIAQITKAAHAQGVLCGFDLSHSIGALPHALHADGVDFAVWCHYKYVSAGPGAVAGLFLHERHHAIRPGLAGWWGSDKSRQFDMSTQFARASDAGALQLGTPHILSLAPLEGALTLLEQAGIARMREKSLRLTTWLMTLTDHYLTPYGFSIATPRTQDRGGHVALCHPEAARIGKALKMAGVIPDFRPPDVLRFAPVALYTRFEDVLQAVEILVGIMEKREFEQYENGRDVIA